MEEPQDTPHPDFVKGFNEGYVMTKHLPDIAEQVAKSAGETLRGSGFQDGRKQFLSEKAKDRYPAWLGGNRADSGLSAPEQTKGRDIEPER